MTVRTWIITLAAVALSGSTGCAAIPVSALGSVASLGNSTVTAGRDTYSFGRLRSAELTNMWAAAEAAELAAVDLGLHRKGVPVVSEDGTEIDMAFVDDQGSQIGVRVQERTRRMVYLREDVGFLASFFGSEIVDRLFLLHLRQHLPPDTKADTRPAATRPGVAP